MESVVDVVRMQLLSSANSKRNQWQSLILIAILSNYRRLWQQLMEVILKMTKLRMVKRFLKKPTDKKLLTDGKEKKEQSCKTLIRLRFNKGEVDNKILKEILNRHAIEFDTVILKNPNSWHVIQPKTITLAEDIYFRLDFTEKPPPVVKTKKKNKKKSDNDHSDSDSSDEEEQAPVVQQETIQDYELHETRGQVYSYGKSLKEVLHFLHETYTPPEPKPVPPKMTAVTKKTALYNMFVGRTTKFDDKQELRGEILEFTISKSLDNIFLEPETREMLLSQVTRFNDPNWYAERGLPRTLGILLHGQPGCGKTSFIKSMCAHLKRRVLIVDFKLVKTISHLRKIFSGNFREEAEDGDVHRFTKDNTIYVFEDFDCMSSVFMDRNLKKERDKEDTVEAQKEAQFHKEMLMLTKLEKIEKLKTSRKKLDKKKNKKKKKKSGEEVNGKKIEPKKFSSSSESSSDEEGCKKKKSAANETDGTAEGGDMVGLGEDVEHGNITDFYSSFYDKDEYLGGLSLGDRKWGGWKPEKQVSLADFLELLDGIIEMDGRIIIMTTNQRENMDSALVRPGRIDVDLELCPPSRELIVEIFAHMYKHIELDGLKKLIYSHYDNLPHKIVSTARVINCFMYTKPELGIKALIESAKSCQEGNGADIDVNLMFKTEEKCVSFNEAWSKVEAKNLPDVKTDEKISEENVIDIWELVKGNAMGTASSARRSSYHNYMFDITCKTSMFETDYGNALNSQWYQVDLRLWAVKVHSYTIRKLEDATFILYNWDLQGSNDGKTWQSISTHRNDSSVVENEVVTFKVSSNTHYSTLRIYSKGPSYAHGQSSTKAHFSLGNWQIMGEVVRL